MTFALRAPPLPVMLVFAVPCFEHGKGSPVCACLLFDLKALDLMSEFL